MNYAGGDDDDNDSDDDGEDEDEDEDGDKQLQFDQKLQAAPIRATSDLRQLTI